MSTPARSSMWMEMATTTTHPCETHTCALFPILSADRHAKLSAYGSLSQPFQYIPIHRVLPLHTSHTFWHVLRRPAHARVTGLHLCDFPAGFRDYRILRSRHWGDGGIGSIFFRWGRRRGWRRSRGWGRGRECEWRRSGGGLRGSGQLRDGKRRPELHSQYTCLTCYRKYTPTVTGLHRYYRLVRDQSAAFS